ncbi:MmcQ/YjbR family DNA-binding protein [Vibrio marisflavi]|uniref:MmcQ/YjbR family DNA-binding protein n=1 Tax=Vibrio marisflavi CECT 7928 TaxID=634439 RepID=A0ABM9A0P4_9VIBR|nr:MmcQ/YjbR family DNA-binding protein [Vibrio marisflavi]CAH0536961.1 hypothetical protein VMF7928_00837 [Vibrio marisflavi CECT 7928]
MNTINEYLSKFPGTVLDYPFGEDVEVYKVKGKMFALVSTLEGRPYITLKCQPEDGEVLTSQFDAITPGYHINKRHWITVYMDSSDIDESLLHELCERSYRLVVSKLKKSERASIESSF